MMNDSNDRDHRRGYWDGIYDVAPPQRPSDEYVRGRENGERDRPELRVAD